MLNLVELNMSDKATTSTSYKPKPWIRSLSKKEYFKIVTHPISSLKQAVKEQDHYVFESSKFAYVQVIGKVVFRTIHREKFSIDINDGTDSITCLIESSLFKKPKPSEKYNIDAFKGNTIIQTAIYGLKLLCNSYPSQIDDVNMGDKVIVIGKFSIYNNKAYIFVNKIQVLEYQED